MLQSKWRFTIDTMNEKTAHDSKNRRSIVIIVHTKRGYETAYEALLKGLLEETKRFPGLEGGQVLGPQGPDRLEYQITLHFENWQAKERWDGSEERRRWVDGMKELEGTSYKVTFVVWTAIFPTVLVLSTLVSRLPFDMPLPLSVFVITAITVPTAIYILLPRLCRLFESWVYRECKVARDYDK